MFQRSSTKRAHQRRDQASLSPSPSLPLPSLPNTQPRTHTHTHTRYTDTFSPRSSSEQDDFDFDANYPSDLATPASSPPALFSSQGKGKSSAVDIPQHTSSYPSPSPSHASRSSSTSQTNLLASRIASYEARTASARSSSRGVSNGRRASISFALTPFGNFYDAATHKFPASSSSEGLRRDYSVEVSGSPRVGKGRSRDVLQEAVEEEEEMDEDEFPPGKEPVSRFKIERDVFPPGSLSSNLRDTSRLLDWEKEGLAAGKLLDSPDAEQEEEARMYWDNLLAQVNETGDRVLREDENDPLFPSTNIEYQRCLIPARGEHSEPSELSERKPGREEVMQVTIQSFFPKYEVTGVFCDDVERLNEDRKRRSTCIDDPDVDPSPLPPCDHCEYVKLPLHERLRNKLPSPSLFTPLTYRSKYHGLQSVEMASTTKDLPLKDDSLKARGMQYDDNKKVIEAALDEDRMLREDPHVVDALKCQFGHSLKALGGMSCGHRHTGSVSDLDTLQYLLLRQQELRRDIERLECTKRAVQTSISTLGLLPVRYRGNVLARKTLGDELNNLTKESVMVEEGMPDVSIDEPCPSAQEQYQNPANRDSIVKNSSNAPTRDFATAKLAVGESFPFVDQTRQRQSATRSSSVYSEGATRTTSSAATPNTSLEQPKSSRDRRDPGHSHSDGHDRTAAHRIMQGLSTNSRSSRACSVGVSVNGESSRIGRREERGKREDVVVTSPTRNDEERYPKRQNIVQQ